MCNVTCFYQLCTLFEGPSSVAVFVVRISGNAFPNSKNIKNEFLHQLNFDMRKSTSAYEFGKFMHISSFYIQDFLFQNLHTNLLLDRKKSVSHE